MTDAHKYRKLVTDIADVVTVIRPYHLAGDQSCILLQLDITHDPRPNNPMARLGCGDEEEPLWHLYMDVDAELRRRIKDRDGEKLT